MSWEDFRRRREAITSVITFAEHNPGAPIPIESMPEVKAVFANRGELLLALQYEWQQLLWAQIELHSLDTDGNPRDAAQICAAAWRAAAARRPVLRQVLDQHLAECNDARVQARLDNLFVSAGIGHHSKDRHYVSPAQVA